MFMYVSTTEKRFVFLYTNKLKTTGPISKNSFAIIATITE